VVALFDGPGLMPCRSLPVPGSVIAIAVMISPVQNCGSQRCFCSSLASRTRYGRTTSLVQAEPDPAVATRDGLLVDDHVGSGSPGLPPPPVLLGHRHAEKALLAGFQPDTRSTIFSCSHCP